MVTCFTFWNNTLKRLPHWRRALFIVITVFVTIENGVAAGMKEIMNIKLPNMIYSSPAVLVDEKHKPRALAFVRHDEDKGDHYFSVDAYSGNGKQLKGFPVLRAKQLQVAPGEQVGVDQSNRWIVIDSLGSLDHLAENGELAVGKTENGLRSMLIHPPTFVEKGNQHGYLLISRNLQPFTKSQNGIDVVDDDGASRPGFPIKFEEWPLKVAPLIDDVNARIYVLMESGAIDGFDWIAGHRLPGFPLYPEWRHKGPIATAMSFYLKPKMIVITNNTDVLTYANLETKTTMRMPVKGAGKLNGVTSSGGDVIVVDDEQNKIYQLDAAATVKHTIDLNQKNSAISYALYTVNNATIGTYMIIRVAYNPGDPSAAINALFEKHATPDDRKEEDRILNRVKTRRFKGEPVTAEQRAEFAKTIIDIRSDLLYKRIGETATMREMDPYMIAQTIVQTFSVDAKGVRVENSDIVHNYAPDTESSNSGIVTPLLQTDYRNQRAYLYIPLIEQEDESEKARGSLLRAYRFDIK